MTDYEKMTKADLVLALQARDQQLAGMTENAAPWRLPSVHEMAPPEPVDPDSIPSRRQAEQAINRLLKQADTEIQILERNIADHPGHKIMRDVLIAYYGSINATLYPL